MQRGDNIQRLRKDSPGYDGTDTQDENEYMDISEYEPGSVNAVSNPGIDDDYYERQVNHPTNANAASSQGTVDSPDYYEHSGEPVRANAASNQRTVDSHDYYEHHAF